MIGGAVLSLAVLVWMMSGASSRASSWSERASDCQRRYQDAEQGEVSDPEEWMRIHHHDYDSSMEGTPHSHGGEPEAEAEPPAASADTVASLDGRIFLIFFALVDAKYTRWGRRVEPQFEFELAMWTTDEALLKTFDSSNFEFWPHAWMMDILAMWSQCWR